jgi:hypothetical protein
MCSVRVRKFTGLMRNQLFPFSSVVENQNFPLCSTRRATSACSSLDCGSSKLGKTGFIFNGFQILGRHVHDSVANFAKFFGVRGVRLIFCSETTFLRQNNLARNPLPVSSRNNFEDHAAAERAARATVAATCLGSAGSRRSEKIALVIGDDWAKFRLGSVDRLGKVVDVLEGVA